MQINKKQKELIKIFIFLFMLSFIIINWNEVSWIFNYKEVTGLVYDFFNPYPDTATALVQVNTTQTVNNQQNNQQNIISNIAVTNSTLYPHTDADNSLYIQNIALTTPVVIAQSTDITMLENDLDKGAVYYPGSVLPGQNGQIVILGHSAPPNWPHIKHDYIFSDIEKLNMGDQIVLNFNNTQYTYKVIDKKIIKPGEDPGSNALTGKNNILTLISCWPPGKNYQRIAITTELIKN